MAKEEECCPPFNPRKWDNKTFQWKNKKFIKDKVFTFFYIPINFGSVMVKLDKKGANGSGSIKVTV